MTADRPPNPDTTGVSLWRRANRFERGVYANLARWLGRRPDHGTAGALVVPYVGLVRTTIWLWIGASVVEMAVVHFIVPWPWVRWPLLVVSIWGLLWMLGFLAGLIIYPHLIEPTRVRIRNGHTVEVIVPISSINDVRTQTKSLATSRTIQCAEDDDQHLFVAVSGQVNIHLALSEPLKAELPGGRYTFTWLSFWADDTTPAVSRLRELVGIPR